MQNVEDLAECVNNERRRSQTKLSSPQNNRFGVFSIRMRTEIELDIIMIALKGTEIYWNHSR